MRLRVYVLCLFAECLSLKELPDISNWNINNISELGGLFYGCSSLKEFPDISKWNTNKIKNADYIFLVAHL